MVVKKNDNSNKINIEIKEDVANGIYSNLVINNHSPSEFIFVEGDHFFSSARRQHPKR